MHPSCYQGQIFLSQVWTASDIRQMPKWINFSPHYHPSSALATITPTILFTSDTNIHRYSENQASSFDWFIVRYGHTLYRGLRSWSSECLISKVVLWSASFANTSWRTISFQFCGLLTNDLRYNHFESTRHHDDEALLDIRIRTKAVVSWFWAFQVDDEIRKISLTPHVICQGELM